MTYWQRLKEHPGVPYAGAMTLLGLIAGLRNPNFDGWVYPLVGAAVGSVFWIPVLLTNMRNKNDTE